MKHWFLQKSVYFLFIFCRCPLLTRSTKMWYNAVWEGEESLIPLIFSSPAVRAITDFYCISSCVHSWLYCTSFVLGWLCGEEGGTHINIILQRHTWRPIPAICCGNSIQRRHVICELTLTVSGRIIRVDIRVHIWTRHNTYCWTLHQPRFSC